MRIINQYNKFLDIGNLYLFAQIVLMILSFIWLASCNQDSDKLLSDNILNSVEISPKLTSDDVLPDDLIFRQKLKLALLEPTVVDQYKKAIRLLVSQKKQKHSERITEQYSNARRLLLPLANAGYADAMFAVAATFLPSIVLVSHNIPSDPEKGIPWLTKAADAGHATAQYLLATWYYVGWGKYRPKEYDVITKHYSESSWKKINFYFHSAAEQGLQIAQSSMALLRQRFYNNRSYDEAKKLEPTRNIESYMWFTLAIQHYNKTEQLDRERKGLVNRLSLMLRLREKFVNFKGMKAEQIAESESLAKEWMKKHPDAYTQSGIPLELSLDNNALHLDNKIQ